MKKKEGFRFHVESEPSSFGVALLLAAVIVAYVAMIFFPTLPAVEGADPSVVVQEDREAAVRAAIPAEEWVMVPNSTGTYNLVPAEIGPAPTPVQSPRP